MTIGIAAIAPKLIHHCIVTTKMKQTTDDLRSPHNLIFDIHSMRKTKNSTFPEASDQPFEKLKKDEEHEKAKWDELINIGEKFKDHRQIVIEKSSKFQYMWDGHLGTIKVTTHRVELTEDENIVSPAT